MRRGGFTGTPYKGASSSDPLPVSKEKELSFPKTQTQASSKELTNINERIKELEKKKQ